VVIPLLAGVLTWLPVNLYAEEPAPAAEREYINVSAARPPGLPFSDAVLTGDTLYLSGAGGFDPETGELPEDPADEARFLMESFKATLAAAGMTMNDLVSVTVYCPDLTLYDTFNGVYRTYFNDGFPARAFIGSGPLLFGMRFEMQGIAVR
jgi:enamine deaminase RidA (YjgF/YER057c/UK114 family)